MNIHTTQANSFSTQSGSETNAPMGEVQTLENRFNTFGPLQGLLQAHPDLLAQQATRRSRWAAVVDSVKQTGIVGTVLAATQGRYAVITPDVQTGFFRYSCFDARGFFSHGTYATAGEALTVIFDMGYNRLERPEMLDEMAAYWH